ncbi:Oligoribonuclease mitochondrial [Scophthalmus maximus]|uniref:Oligoribonuclease mitochondrial n=1 Tax=Scophthalmus maximus TaxID=52904 RepID=A0A2U9B9C3_SCOMX|nr:Oligoribonuclease mitochondrial [Scophthalmus maximus]
MPACLRTSAWGLAAVEFLCRKRQSVARCAKAAYHFNGSVLQGSVLSSRVIFQSSTAGSRFGSGFDVRVPRKHSMLSTAMSQRMVWVDLESGLTQAVQDSKITLEQAEYEFLSFIRQHTPPGQCPLAGNSVHADKRFLDKHMPQFMHHLHYRIIDVSTIKELCRRWFPEEYKMTPHKKSSHRALGDIQESIKELQYYQANIFKATLKEKKHMLVENGNSNKM